MSHAFVTSFDSVGLSLENMRVPEEFLSKLKMSREQFIKEVAERKKILKI